MMAQVSSGSALPAVTRMEARVLEDHNVALHQLRLLLPMNGLPGHLVTAVKTIRRHHQYGPQHGANASTAIRLAG